MTSNSVDVLKDDLISSASEEQEKQTAASVEDVASNDVTSELEAQAESEPKPKKARKPRGRRKQTKKPASTSFGTYVVYEVPVEGSYRKPMSAAFEYVTSVDNFVQVKYMKHAFGLVRGYIKSSEWPVE